MSYRQKIITALTLAVTVTLLLAMTGVGPIGAAGMSIFRTHPLFSGHESFKDNCLGCHERWKGPRKEKCVSCHSMLAEQDTHAPFRLILAGKVEQHREYAPDGCLSCHREHAVSGSSGGYTGPADLCSVCHPPFSLKGEHREFEPETCRTPSCHSYHYSLSKEDYKSGSPERLLQRSIIPGKPVPAADAKPEERETKIILASDFYRSNPVIAAQYAISSHNGTRATCFKCHKGKRIAGRPSFVVCAQCHEAQTKSYGSGAHGAARLLSGGKAAGLKNRPGCGDCHDIHSLRMDDARRAACVKCHDSPHVTNYGKSGHFRYLTDPVFAFKPMEGVDCAGCHMPRVESLNGATLHNEGHTSITKARMAREVCVRCHGLKYALESLFDPEVVKSNFTFHPTRSAPGLNYAYK